MVEKRKYGLLESDFNAVVFIIKQNPKVYKAILFGSRAKGTNRNGSDVDIALIGDDLDLDDILDVSAKIEKLILPYKFDLIIYDRVKESALIAHIDRVGIVLFERTEQ